MQHPRPAPTPDASTLMRVITLQQQLDDVTTEQEFLTWAAGPLQDVLPHGSVACGVLRTERDGVALRRVLQRGWPPGYFDALTEDNGRFRSPVIGRWAHERAPQSVTAADTAGLGDALWHEVFHDMDLRNMAAHGVLDHASRSASYFCFSRMDDAPGDRSHTLLRLLTPHMALALQRALFADELSRDNLPPWFFRLTERERIVLHWMCQGKTNWEIARICERSEHTIKNQVESVRQKMRVSNRAQACAMAADVPLLPPQTATAPDPQQLTQRG